MGRALLNAGAERHLRLNLLIQKNFGNPDTINSANVLSFALTEFYLGQVLEKTGRKGESIQAYRTFLSQFGNSDMSLPQSHKPALD